MMKQSMDEAVVDDFMTLVFLRNETHDEETVAYSALAAAVTALVIAGVLPMSAVNKTVDDISDLIKRIQAVNN